MNTYHFNIFILVICISYGCTKHQYNGSHIKESHQKTLTDEHNNFHVKETQRVLDDNEKRNEKREKQADKKRRENLSLKNFINKKKRSLKFDIY